MAAFFNFIAFLYSAFTSREQSGDLWCPDRTWWAAPSSSSHALIGGLVGAGLTKAGVSAIVWTGLLTTGAFIVLSPLFDFFLALFLILTVSWVFVRANPRTIEPISNGFSLRRHLSGTRGQ